MDRGAWWATVHGVTKSQTGLKRLSTHGLVSYQGNQQRGMTLTTTLIRRVTSWAWGQVHRKVSRVNGCRRRRQWSGRACAETIEQSPRGAWPHPERAAPAHSLLSLLRPQPWSPCFLLSFPELQRGADVLPGAVVLKCPSPAWSPVPPH